MSEENKIEKEIREWWMRPHLIGDANREAEDIASTIMGLIRSNDLVKIKVIEQLLKEIQEVKP